MGDDGYLMMGDDVYLMMGDDGYLMMVGRFLKISKN